MHTNVYTCTQGPNQPAYLPVQRHVDTKSPVQLGGACKNTWLSADAWHLSLPCLTYARSGAGAGGIGGGQTCREDRRTGGLFIWSILASFQVEVRSKCPVTYVAAGVTAAARGAGAAY